MVQGRHTVRRGECQLIFTRRAPWERVTFTKHIWVEFSELDCSMPNAIHPISLPNILRYKRRPDGNRLERSAASTHFKTYAARVFISEDPECMQIGRILDLAGFCERLVKNTWGSSLPSKFLILSGLEVVF